MKKKFLIIISVIGILSPIVFSIKSLCSPHIGNPKTYKYTSNKITSNFIETRISKEQFQIYDKLYNCLANFEKRVTLPTNDIDLIEKTLEAVLFDHVEIFWCDGGYEYSELQSNNSFTIKPKYKYTEFEANALGQKMQKITNSIISNAQKNTNQILQLKYIFDYIINRTTYLENENDQNITSVFLNTKSVCAGYAKSFKYILDQLGYENGIILGKDRNNNQVNHCWNSVNINNDWFYFDLTYGDSEIGNEFSTFRYAYFGFSSNAMLNIYIPESPYNKTLNSDFNFYKTNDAYFNELDYNKINALLTDALKSEQSIISLQCSNQKVFNTIKEELIINSKIYDYFFEHDLNVNSIKYTSVEETNTLFISFYQQ